MHTHIHGTLGEGQLVSRPQLLSEEGGGVDDGVSSLDAGLCGIATDSLQIAVTPWDL